MAWRVVRQRLARICFWSRPNWRRSVFICVRIAAQPDRSGEEGLAPVPRAAKAAERQGLLRWQFQWGEVVLDAEFQKPGLQFRTQVGEAGRGADDVEDQQFVPAARLAPVAEQQIEQGMAVLPPRDRHRHPVAVGQQVEFPQVRAMDFRRKKAMRSGSPVILDRGRGHKPRREWDTGILSRLASSPESPGT